MRMPAFITPATDLAVHLVDIARILVRGDQADDEGLVGSSCVGLFAREIEAGAVIFGGEAETLARRSQGGESLRAAKAAVGVRLLKEEVGVVLVELRALGLPVGPERPIDFWTWRRKRWLA